MSNWGTAVQNITERVHRYGDADPAIIKRAIARAIRKYSTENLWFNQETYDFTTTSGTFEYGTESATGAADGYPADTLKAIKLSLSVSSSWYDMKPFSIDEFRERFTSTSLKGYPTNWAWYGKNFMLYPIPNGAYTVRLDYIKDLGTPVPSYGSGAWTFAWSTTGAAIVDSDTNDWFTEGLDLICAAAVYDIASQTLGNIKLAQLARQEADEIFDELRIDSEGSEISPDPRPFF